MEWSARHAHGVPSVSVLDHDRDLADVLTDEELADARRLLMARSARLRRGAWRPRRDAGLGEGGLGVLVLEGLLTREVSLGGTTGAELVGPGDLLRPWERFEGTPVSLEVSWQVLDEAHVALLGEHFMAVAARWPALLGALFGRANRRADTLALYQAIGSTTGLELRLQILFWHLADRWGRVRPDGVLLPLPLTHATIGRLIGARRPSVSTALKVVERDGLIRRERGSGWLLTRPSADQAPDVAVAA
jgi:CRP/FNR family transcriptional regulator, cyclic AMP receptor protein